MKRAYNSLTGETLKVAIEDVNCGMSLRLAAETHKINRQTLANKIAGLHAAKPGRPCALKEEEEKCLAERLILLSEWGFPCTSLDIRKLVRNSLDRSGIKHPQFRNNTPGWDWVQGFMARNDLTSRLAGNIKVSRAKVDAQIIREYVTNLGKSLDGVPPENLINYDETAMTDDPGRKKVIIKRGTKYPEAVKNHSRAAVSVMFAGTAAGDLLPPYVVYKAINIYEEWTQGGPTGAKYTFAKSGWFDEKAFQDWYFKICLPYLRRKVGKKAIIGDNLSSHISETVINSCKEHNIIFLCLPPNSTHLTQPLDVAFFGPLKRKWRSIINEWRTTASGKKHPTLPKALFPGKLNELFSVLNTENLKAGFRTCGLHPISAEPLLAKLPRTEISSKEMDKSIIEHLQVLRGHDKEAGPSRARRTKLNVVAGCAVGADSSDDSSSDDSSSDEESNSEVTDDNVENDQPNSQTSSVGPKRHKILVNKPLVGLPAGVVQAVEADLHMGDFLVIRVRNRTQQKCFIGQITSMSMGTGRGPIEVSFMKRTGEFSYVFPDNDDKSAIDIADIVGKVTQIEPDRRGSFWTAPFQVDKIKA